MAKNQNVQSISDERLSVDSALISQALAKKPPAWPKVLFLFIMTAVIVGYGTYYFVNKKATSDKNNLQTQIDDLNKKITDSQTALVAAQAASTTSPSTTTMATTQLAPTTVPSTWKTYTSTLGNYSVKYPSSWVFGNDSATEVAAMGGTQSFVVFFKNQADKTLAQTQTSLHQMAIETSVSTKTLDQEVQIWQASIVPQGASSTTKSVTLGVHHVVKINVTGSNQTICLMVENNKLFDMEIGMSTGVESQSDPTTIEQMMGTIVVN